MKKIKSLIVLLMGCSLFSCHYLDVVPDGVATIDVAFSTRDECLKYLATCYSFMPNYGDYVSNPAFMGGDEVWCLYPPLNYSDNAFQIARGNQGVAGPQINYWDGENGGKPLFQALRECNIFLENIDKVPDMTTAEKLQWKSEVKFLKAFYHFYLLRMYGPIPIVDKNVGVDDPKSLVNVYRMPVDSCVDYICRLMDTAATGLPNVVRSASSDLGRITKPIALSMKAYVRVMAASPLFNGNADYANFKDNKGTQLFNPTYSKAKWDSAVSACKVAIDDAASAGFSLYHFQQQFQTFNLSDQTVTMMSVRNSVCEKFNSEEIWAATNGSALASDLQRYSSARIDPEFTSNESITSQSSPTMKVVEMFYSKNGVPIDEDVDYDYPNRFALAQGDDEHKYYIAQGWMTSGINFNREPRFYADLGFDGSTWYGDGHYDDNDQWVVMARPGMPAARQQGSRYSVTGYWPKKLVYYQNTIEKDNYNVTAYPWPIMRLASLYLLYAEALNEASGPGAEAFKYIDMVRARAGIPTVAEAWSTHSRYPTKFTTKEGFRDIIHRERLIEMAFEGDRFWDLRRWKTALTEQNQPVRGWDIDQDDINSYYRVIVLFNQSFRTRDYFWPIKEDNLTINRNLVQNPGW